MYKSWEDLILQKRFHFRFVETEGFPKVINLIYIHIYIIDIYIYDIYNNISNIYIYIYIYILALFNFV